MEFLNEDKRRWNELLSGFTWHSLGLSRQARTSGGCVMTDEDLIKAQAAEIERLRGAMAKAVETLEDIRRYSSCGYAGLKSVDTLSVLTGDKT